MIGVIVAVIGVAAILFFFTRATPRTVRRILTFGILAVLGLAVLIILDGPSFLGYHHCGAGDQLLGARELRFFGQLWCKQ